MKGHYTVKHGGPDVCFAFEGEDNHKAKQDAFAVATQRARAGIPNVRVELCLLYTKVTAAEGVEIYAVAKVWRVGCPVA